MNQEFETQVLDIDKDEIIKKLRKLGAKEEPEVFQKRWVFDIRPCTDKSQGEWIRLRQAGDKKPLITYKNKLGKGISDTTEIEIEVDNFDKAFELLSRLKFEGKYYQENKRHKFVLENIEFTLDTWPMIPTILEVEAKSEKDVEKGLKLLDLVGQDAGHIGMVNTYNRYGIDLHSMKELKF